MGPGPYGTRAPGPSLLGRTDFQKMLKQICQMRHFGRSYEDEKDAGRPYDHFRGGIAPRSLLCVRKQRIPFLPNTPFGEGTLEANLQAYCEVPTRNKKLGIRNQTRFFARAPLT